MKFKYENGLVRLVSVRKAVSQNGKDLYFAKVADIETYESNDYMINRNECNPDSLVAGYDYHLYLTVDGRFSSVYLVPASNL